MIITGEELDALKERAIYEEMARILKENCNKHRSCDGCVFCKDIGEWYDCTIQGQPCDWEIYER